MNSQIRIIFTSDLHGSNACFRKLLDAAKEYKVNAAFVGGDISGKFLTKIRRISAFEFEGELAGKAEKVRVGDELVRLESDIANTGGYSIRVNPGDSWADSSFDEEIAKIKSRQRLQTWLWWAERAFKPANIRLLFICGNDDPWELDEVIAASHFAENPETSVIEVNGYEVIGESSCNKTPWNCPRDMSEEEIEKRLRSRISSVKNSNRTIFLVHTPPYNSGLDEAPKLDPTLTIQHKAGHTLMQPVGSTAVRTLITEFQPLLSLHGHVHESPGFVQIGRTLCCNPGSEYDSSILRAALIEIRDQTIVSKVMINR